jgi:DNA invertase Pin-like site-specific DNA recombinase
MNVITYSRVSTSNQDYNRQIEELRSFCKKMNWNIHKEFSEVISGGLETKDRPVLTESIQHVKSNKIDKVLVWDVSRLGRNTLEVLKTIQIFTENKISLHIKNYNLETLDVDGKTNPLTNFMISILLSVSNLERSQIKERMVSGYNRHIKNGGRVGRRMGYRKSDEEILNEYPEIIKYLKKERPIREIMKLTGKSNGTIMKVKRILSN